MKHGLSEMKHFIPFSLNPVNAPETETTGMIPNKEKCPCFTEFQQGGVTETLASYVTFLWVSGV